MIGLTEILVILVALGLIAIFGRKTLKKLMKDAFCIKKDYEEVKSEFTENSK